MRVLIIEDEEKTADYLRRGLTEQGYAVDVARDGIEGLHLALENDHAIIILDVMLPGLDGFGVLRALRARKQTPVIMLTAREQVDDPGASARRAPSRSPTAHCCWPGWPKAPAA